MSDAYSFLDMIVTGDVLLIRWPGLEESRFAEYIEQWAYKLSYKGIYPGVPVPCYIAELRIDSEGEKIPSFRPIIHLLTDKGGTPFWINNLANETSYDFSNIFFDLKQVERWEEGKDWLFRLTADKLQWRWNLSPAMLERWIEEYKIPSYHETFGQVETLKNVKTSDFHRVFFHNSDIKHFESAHPEIFQVTTPSSKRAAAVEQASPGGPTKKQLLKAAQELIDGGRLAFKDNRYVLAFKYHETPNLTWDRAYRDLPGTDHLSKVKTTQERNFYAWAEKGKKICRDHATQ